MAAKRIYSFAGVFAFASASVALLALIYAVQGENTVTIIADTQLISGYHQVFFLGLTGIIAALALGLITHLLDNIPRLMPAVAPQTSWDYSLIPLLTTSALLIGDGIAFLLFLESNERTQHQDGVIIGPYLFLFLLALIALGFLWIQLDHLAAIFITVLSNGMGVMLARYEAYSYDNPFQEIGMALSIWALIAILLNFSPGVTRTSRNVFILSSTTKNKPVKVSLTFGVAIGSVPAFHFSISILEQTPISSEVLFAAFGLFLLPISVTLLVVAGPYPEGALNKANWLKVLISAIFLSWA
jgi:hypothetical protein